jgi:hypothetical protein
MPILFLYILKLSCSLGVIWLFYRLLLRNLTFYHLNRWYLLGYSLLAFLIPLIDIGPALKSDRPGEPVVLQFIPAMSEYTPALVKTPVAQPESWSAWTVASAILMIGTVFFAVRIVLRWLALRQLRSSATLIQGGKCKIYQVEGSVRPFSYGNAIYINRELHTEQEWEEIILHEYEHVRGRHTIDILLAEWLTILNWYNPFAWLIRHSIRQNLEFIADRKVLAGGRDKKDYQYHLLKVIGQPQYQLANNFNFSSLKKRIVMMNKLHSARLNLVKFLFILPLLAVLLVAFRDSYSGLWNRRGGPVFINAVGVVIGLPDKAPLEGVTVSERRTGVHATTDARGFYKMRIPVTTDSIRVRLEFTKSGYKDNFHENFKPLVVKETVGMIDNNALESETKPFHEGFMLVPFMHPPPVDPSYEDAFASMKECLQENVNVQRLLAMQRAHPEVALFYTIEHRPKELVIHRDGSVEKFGFDGGPTIADLEKKYGQVPIWLKQDDPGAGNGYFAHWATISAEAEKTFHPANSTARAIIFPGDSRVIAVDGAGKARIYDMESNAPEERPAFEQAYGPLPKCVPPASIYPASRAPSPKRDTVPAPRKDTVKWGYAGMDSLGHVRWEFGNTHFMRIQNRDAREGDSLRKPGRDSGRVFGKDTIDDAKDVDSGNADLSPNRKFPNDPRYFVDGVETDRTALGKMNLGDIMSIEVRHDSSATTQSGLKGGNMIVLITTRHAGMPKPL